MKLIEAYGTGIIKIMESYSLNNHKPTLKVSDIAFLISLPNLNNNKMTKMHSSYEQKILDYLKTHTHISRKEVEMFLDVGQTMAGRVLRRMVKNNQL